MTIETWLNDIFFQRGLESHTNKFLSYDEMINQLSFPIIVIGNKSDLMNDEEVYIPII